MNDKTAGAPQGDNAQPITEQAPTKSSIESIISETALRIPEREQISAIHEGLAALLRGALQGTASFDQNLIFDAKEMIDAIDNKISTQLNEVLHDRKFQSLEATWRGAYHLVSNTETGPMLKLELVDATKKELLDDFRDQVAYDRSYLYRTVHNGGYGRYGATPYSAMFADFSFGPSKTDVELLTHMGRVAAQIHAPLIGAASPELFGLSGWEQIETPVDLATELDPAKNPNLVPYDSFREHADSRYVALLTPDVMMRVPYGTGSAEEPVTTYRHEENVTGKNLKNYLWGNPVYHYGARITDAAARYGWCQAIVGPNNGGRISGLPAHTYDNGEGKFVLQSPLKIALTENRGNELRKLGMIPIQHHENKDMAVVFHAPTLHRPQKYQDDAATANAKMAAQLPYIMTASRFAHYLKVLLVNKIGDFSSREQLEYQLKKWINFYVLKQGEGDAKRKKPLQHAEIQVFDDPATVGGYHVIAKVFPHYLMDSVSVDLRLVGKPIEPA